MRVLLDTTYARRGPSGTGVYIDRLARRCATEGVEVVEAANERRPAPAGGGLGSVRNLALDARWTQVDLPRRARDVRADVLHHPLPALAVRAPCPQVVTIHDLAFERLPALFSPAFRRYASQTHRRAARGADAVVAVSETTRRDARARWGLDDAKIVVALHGPGQEPRARRRQPRRALPLHRRRRAAQEPRPAARRARALPRGVPDGRGRRPRGARARASTGCRSSSRAAPRPTSPAFAASPSPTSRSSSTAPPRSSTRRCTRASGSRRSRRCSPASRWSPPARRASSRRAATRRARRPVRRARRSHAARAVASDPAARADLARRGRASARAFSWQASARAHIAAYTLATTT